VSRILIVEDDPGIAHLLGTLLSFDGHEVEQAQDGNNLIPALEQTQPDLVIMDVHLRTGEGLDLLQELRAHPDPDTARTPVLMMSGMDYRFRCRRAGANGFLQKPFDRQALLEAIGKINETETTEENG
jgi:DNA-binding response OmpR family regulator